MRGWTGGGRRQRDGLERRDREGKDEPASHWCRTRSDIEPSTRISNDVDDGSPSCDTE